MFRKQLNVITNKKHVLAPKISLRTWKRFMYEYVTRCMLASCIVDWDKVLQLQVLAPVVGFVMIAFAETMSLFVP